MADISAFAGRSVPGEARLVVIQMCRLGPEAYFRRPRTWLALSDEGLTSFVGQRQPGLHVGEPTQRTERPFESGRRDPYLRCPTANARAAIMKPIPTIAIATALAPLSIDRTPPAITSTPV
ncbi:hypothetical protein FXF51_24665 [Nonomuraea sp. PA05]|uniref:hypothetical protein n=1 Tax=Nonomuraea sp. PA05 TaxID=2604466 RepID=UPI0011DA267A|nr:hypothetical protein [Nonomuraea sp. PA05]TYB62637.1 hypothetical protein FXF51_24665 [Nonomuraea sp. PA05]